MTRRSAAPESVLSDVQMCITGLKRIGLIVNPKKTEIINVGLDAGKLYRVIISFNELHPEIKVTELTKMELLGSPILADATRCCIVKKLSEYKKMNDRILLLDGHPGLFLLKNSFSLPRLLFTLRSAPLLVRICQDDNFYPVDVVKIIHYSKMCFTKIIINVRDIKSIFVYIIIQLFSFYSEI